MTFIMIAIHKSMNTRTSRLLMWGDSETCSGFPNIFDQQLNQVIGEHQQEYKNWFIVAATGAPVYLKVGNQANETIPCLTRQITTQKHYVQPAPKTINTFSPTEHVL